jgi:NAD-dependent SIR2 family protein deacetylase
VQNSPIQEAAAVLSAADAILITAGAGMGVDSGLPDFRSAHGFWRAYPAIEKLGLSFEEMANPAWFNRDPNLAWAFYGHRLNLYRNTTPHQGFNQLLTLAKAKSHGYFVFTSNVDGHFQKAGFTEDRIVECHGSIHYVQCTAPCTQPIWDADAAGVQIDNQVFRAQEPLPKCRNCSALARPNILMFGDWSWIGDRTENQRARFQTWLDELARCSATLAVVELGAGCAIPTVRQTSELVMRKIRGRLIRINPRDHAIPLGQLAIPLGAKEGLQRIVEAISEQASS